VSCPVDNNDNNTGLVGCGPVSVLERPRVEQTEVDDEDDYDRNGDYDGDAEHDENPEVLTRWARGWSGGGLADRFASLTQALLGLLLSLVCLK